MKIDVDYFCTREAEREAIKLLIFRYSYLKTVIRKILHIAKLSRIYTQINSQFSMLRIFSNN